MRPNNITKERGFLTFAQKTPDVDYIRLAYGLALSIKATQTKHGNLSIAVTPGEKIPKKYEWAFDEIIEIPWDDNAKNSTWKLENEWKAYHITPYQETIKLDADMLFLSDYTHWWDILGKTSLTPTVNVVDYRGRIVTSDYYRTTFTKNELPNVYSAFFYFKQDQTAMDFFNLVELITFNWEYFTYEFLDNSRPKQFSTDVAYGLALKILDVFEENRSILPDLPTFTHMKSHLQDWDLPDLDENWLNYVGAFYTPDLQLKIDLHTQQFPFHYHVKEFLSDEMIEMLEDKVRNAE